MYAPKRTRSTPGCTPSPSNMTPPVGSSGRITPVSGDAGTYLICRTVRGRGGWGVHTEEGDLLVSGWPTRARALEYVGRKLTAAAPAGGVA